MVIRKVSNTLRDSIYSLFKSVISDFGLYEQVEFRDSMLTITFPNGSEFIFKGIDDPEKIKSIANIDDIICEELTELSQDDFEQLNLRLRSKNPYNQIHMMYNPISKSNWVYEYFHNREINKDTTMLLHTTYLDNRFLPKEYVNSLNEMKETNYNYWKIYAMGEFATLDKTIYTNWEIDDFNYRKLIKKDDSLIGRFGIDWGFTNDPTAFVGLLIDKINKKLYIFDEFQERGMLNNEIAEKLIDMGYSGEIIIGDSSEPRTIEEVKRLGVHRLRGAKKGNNSILNGIQFLQQYEMIVHSKCEHIIEELQNYTWQKDKNGIYINKPIDKYNHSLDALRYAVEDINGGNRKLKLLDRSLLGL